MRSSCGDLLAKKTNKYEKTAAEFAKFKVIIAYCKDLRGHYFKQQKEDVLIITNKNSDPNHNYIDETSAW